MDPFTLDENRSKTFWTANVQDLSAMLRNTSDGDRDSPDFLEARNEDSITFGHPTSSDPLESVNYTGEYYFPIIDEAGQEGLSPLEFYEYGDPVSASACGVYQQQQMIPPSESSSPDLLCGELLSTASSPEIGKETKVSSSQSKGTSSFPTLDFLRSPVESKSKPAKKSYAEREAKNRREQERIKEKNQALTALKNTILSSDVLSAIAEQQRWTEKVTLDQAIHVIEELERSIIKATGQLPKTPKPFVAEVNKIKKKEPNVFLEFSEVMRYSFMEALKVAIFPHMVLQQKDVKVDNRYVTKLLSAVWNCLPSDEKYLKWRRLSVEEKQPFVEKARKIIHENLSTPHQ